jgi:hypothetical protein
MCHGYALWKHCLHLKRINLHSIITWKTGLCQTLCLRQAKACTIIGGLVNPRETFRVACSKVYILRTCNVHNMNFLDPCVQKIDVVRFYSLYTISELMIGSSRASILYRRKPIHKRQEKSLLQVVMLANLRCPCNFDIFTLSK